MLALVRSLRRAMRAGDQEAVSVTYEQLRQRIGRAKALALMLRLDQKRRRPDYGTPSRLSPASPVALRTRRSRFARPAR